MAMVRKVLASMLTNMGVAHLLSLPQSNRRLDALSGIIVSRFDERIMEHIAVLRHDALMARMLMIEVMAGTLDGQGHAQGDAAVFDERLERLEIACKCSKRIRKSA